MARWVKGMRDSFFDSLYKLAKKNKNLVLITSDTGAICHEDFKNELSRQYVNVGIAEQNMIGVAAGLAMSGKKVYVYAIVPFATMRCYEQIRVDLCCMNLPVTVVGIGVGFDYSTLGPTHHGTEDIALMRSLPGMDIFSPCDSLTAEKAAEITSKMRTPAYIRLDRTGTPLVYKNKNDIDFARGFSLLKKGKDLYIISTGRMAVNALAAADKLREHSIDAGVIDLFRLKPLNETPLFNALKKAKYLVALEEHFTSMGMGAILSNLLIKKAHSARLKEIGIPNNFCRRYGTREYLYKLNKIDPSSLAGTIVNWVKNK